MIHKFEYPKHYVIYIDDYTGQVIVISRSARSRGKELTQRLNSFGYLVVKMNEEHHTIHSIVAKFMIGDRPKNLCVNHKDGNKLNNRPDNLEYVTIAQNIRHSIENGMHICNRPELLSTYKDGRTKDKVAYKKQWYEANKERIALRARERYNQRKLQ